MLVFGVLRLPRKGMDQNFRKIPGASKIAAKHHPPRNGAHITNKKTPRVSQESVADSNNKNYY